MSDELTRGEIRDRLTAFAARWSARAGDERKEAQQFLIELLECYGVDWHSSPHVFEHTFEDGSRADLLWPGRLLVEMKSTSHSEQLEAHLPQAKGYWEQAGDVEQDVPRPKFMVLCSFQRLIVYELGAFGESPRAQISLDELPERLEVLDSREGSLSTYDVLGELFEWLAREDQRPTGGMFRGVPFVNGGLFERPARLELETAERELLLTAALADWSDVEPAVFGGLFRPNHGPSRWVIDFGFRSLEECERDFPEAVEIVRKKVKPHRDKVRRAVYREKWWRFAEPIKEMREQLEGLSRYVAAPAQGKRIIYTWQEPRSCPSNLTIVFAFDDDYSMGILSSTAHAAWTVARCSTLEDRLRYTPTTVFMSFPWPDRTSDSVEAVGAATAALISHRDGLCLEKGIGLTTLYNQLEEGAHRELRDLRLELDRAVADAYAWPRKFAQDEDELVRLLLEWNLAIGRGEILYAPFPLADAGGGSAQGQLA